MTIEEDALYYLLCIPFLFSCFISKLSANIRHLSFFNELRYLGQTRKEPNLGFGKMNVTEDFWESEDYFQKWPHTISGWIKWLDERMENFYKTKCNNKTNNPYIDKLIGK